MLAKVVRLCLMMAKIVLVPCITHNDTACLAFSNEDIFVLF